MINYKFNKTRLFSGTAILISICFFLICALYPDMAQSGPYISSAHGNSNYGVKRSATGFPTDYIRGLCTHCHEQHASINGAEPEPASGTPSKFSLFYDNYISQTGGFCFECHRNLNSYQESGSIINRSYSFRAGGWTADTLDDILQAFSFTSPGTSHNLSDIRDFIKVRWGYNAESNPCAACHNPHSAQGDPLNDPNSTKSLGSRGWPVSRPSMHSTDNNSWGLWGDSAGEKMSDYTSSYQSPYRYNSTTSYEPDGSITQNGSNLADYVTFCTDCHNNVNLIPSTPLGRNLYTFNWNSEKHGVGIASDACSNILSPYQVLQCGNYTLACTDCHEPHGSPNLFLIRKEVNSSVVTVETGTAPGPDGKDNKEWVYLCGNCHDGLLYDTNHPHPLFIPPDTEGCSAIQCHPGGEYRVCTDCHFHGNSTIDGTPYNESLF